MSLALGFIQILYGLFIAFSENWKAGDKFAACADQGGWILFLCGLVLFGCAAGGYVSASLALPGKIVAAAGAVILVATQGREKPSIFGKIFSGVMSLYNVTGYLGDVLSYSRLLALGLLLGRDDGHGRINRHIEEVPAIVEIHVHELHAEQIVRLVLVAERREVHVLD